MIKAVLFDLDGTLLPLDHKRFLRDYMAKIGAHVAHLVSPQLFVTQLLKSTAVMVTNKDAAKTNEEVFTADFYSRIGLQGTTLAPILEDFYATKFPLLSGIANPNPLARRAIQAVLEQELQVAIATNPIFPKMAIEERLRWAGIADMPFSHITCYEKSHFCKPNPDFYIEVATVLGRKPEECLMVGNDVEEDLIAADVGMKTFLVTDCLINAKGLARSADRTGSLQELLAWLEKRGQERWL